MELHCVGKRRAQVVGGAALARPGDVVLLALDRHQRDTANPPGSTRRPRCIISPLGRAWRTNTVSTVCEIELGREVHDGEVLVVELAVLLGRIAVAANEMQEQVLVGAGVPVDVHRHEARELQEARIDLAAGARIRPGNGRDDVVREPIACRASRRPR